MAKTMHLEVITPYRVVLDQDVEFFTVRALDGELGVLPNHSPLFASLAPCILKFRKGGKDDYVTILGGFLEVSNNRAAVMADVAELAADIDVVRAKQAKERAEIALSENREVSQRFHIESSMRRALLRLQAAELIRHRRPRTAELMRNQ